jgi:hypothetical protein
VFAKSTGMWTPVKGIVDPFGKVTPPGVDAADNWVGLPGCLVHFGHAAEVLSVPVFLEAAFEVHCLCSAKLFNIVRQPTNQLF